MLRDRVHEGVPRPRVLEEQPADAQRDSAKVPPLQKHAHGDGQDAAREEHHVVAQLSVLGAPPGDAPLGGQEVDEAKDLEDEEEH